MSDLRPREDVEKQLEEPEGESFGNYDFLQ